MLRKSPYAAGRQFAFQFATSVGRGNQPDVLAAAVGQDRQGQQTICVLRFRVLHGVGTGASQRLGGGLADGQPVALQIGLCRGEGYRRR